MNEKGFVTSALLYGILILFFVLVLGTLSVISNRKLATDRLKESALIEVENLKTNESCFSIDQNTCRITGYDASSCGTVVFIDKNNIRQCDLSGIDRIQGVSNGYVYIRSNVDISSGAFSENSNVTFITVNLGTSEDGKSGTFWGATNSYKKAY